MVTFPLDYKVRAPQLRVRCTAALSLLLFAVLFSSSPSIAEELDNDAHLIKDQTRIQRQTRVFERDLAELRFHAKLDCNPMIEITTQIGRDVSYGAICKVNLSGKQRQIMLCNDTMIGKFTFKASGFIVSENEAIEFTRLNCRPGG